MIPYEPALITRLVRTMPDAALKAATPINFQTWPAKRIAKASVIQEIINNERASRRRVQ